MSEWLAMLEDIEGNSNPLRDTITKLDKTTQNEELEGFCAVLSGCRVKETEKGRGDFRRDPAPQGQQLGGLKAAQSKSASPTAKPVEKDHCRHGHTFDGAPKTWTGKVVSLAGRRQLSEWEKHGPDGRHWNGLTRRWEVPEWTSNTVRIGPFVTNAAPPTFRH